MEVKTNKTYVFKVGNEYLESVFEPFSEEDDECNWTFTNKLSNARKFYSIVGDYVAPKYLWIDKEERNANTAEDLCNFFSGDFIEILITEKWEELREISLKS